MEKTDVMKKEYKQAKSDYRHAVGKALVNQEIDAWKHPFSKIKPLDYYMEKNSS